MIINSKNIKDNNNNFKNDKEFKSNPKDINFLNDIIIDLYSRYCLDNSFLVFKSIYDILYLIYAKENRSIIIYNLIDNKK